MSRDVLAQLIDAGVLLDHDGRAAVAERVTDGDALVPLTPLDGDRPRARGPWLAAAAVVLVVVAAALLSSRGGGLETRTVDPATEEVESTDEVESVDEIESGPEPVPDEVPDAPGEAAGAVVALIPGRGVEGWEAVTRAETGTTPLRTDQVIVVPAGGDPGRSVAIRRDEGDPGPVGGMAEVSGSGLTGWWRSDSGRGRAELVVAPDAAGAGLTMWTGQNVTTAELFEIAAALDRSRPLGGQAVGEGWQLITPGSASGWSHNFQLVDGMAGPDRRWLWGTTYTQVGEEMRWFVDEPYLGSAVVVRGRPGVLIVEQDGHMATVVWQEEPDVVVQLTWGRLDAPADERAREVLAAAEDLVPVDVDRWGDFTAEVVPWP